MLLPRRKTPEVTTDEPISDMSTVQSFSETTSADSSTIDNATSEAASTTVIITTTTTMMTTTRPPERDPDLGIISNFLVIQ